MPLSELIKSFDKAGDRAWQPKIDLLPGCELAPEKVKEIELSDGTKIKGAKVKRVVLADDAQLNSSEIAGVSLDNPKFGQLRYGKTPGGWDGWMFHENGGGGTIDVLYANIDGDLYVGAVDQSRPNMSGESPNAIGGFGEVGESSFDTAARESREEVGLPESVTRKALEGAPGNANRAFFVTDEPGEGVTFCCVELAEAELEKGDGDFYRIRSDILKPASPGAEKISGCRLIPAAEAARVPDMFLNAAVARLAAYLEMI